MNEEEQEEHISKSFIINQLIKQMYEEEMNVVVMVAAQSNPTECSAHVFGNRDDSTEMAALLASKMIDVVRAKENAAEKEAGKILEGIFGKGKRWQTEGF